MFLYFLICLILLLFRNVFLSIVGCVSIAELVCVLFVFAVFLVSFYLVDNF